LFLAALLTLLRPDRSAAAETILTILSNLIADDTIGPSVHIAFTSLPFFETVAPLLPLSRGFALKVGLVLWSFVDGFAPDALPEPLVEQLLPVISASVLTADAGYAFAGVLSSLLRNPTFKSAVRGSDLPGKLLAGLQLCHDSFIDPVCDSIFGLCEVDDIDPVFATRGFLDLCGHLLLTSSRSTISHVLRVVDLFPVDLLRESDVLGAVVWVLREGAFEPRANAGLVLMKYLREAPDDAVAELAQPPVIAALAGNLLAMGAQDVVCFLDTCARVAERNPDLGERMAANEDFVAVLAELLESGAAEVVKYAVQLAEAIGLAVSWEG
jgi:hypothetical protein